MNVKILGTGCANCKRLEANTREALASLGMEADVEKVEDLPAIMSYGILRTPGLVVDGEVVLAGQVASPAQIARLLQERRGARS